MRLSARLGLAALAAAVMLVSVVATASANRLSVSNRNIRATWASIEFHAEFGSNILCPFTMEGSFHSSTIAKVREALIGFISRAIAARPCTGGEAWVHNGTERLSNGNVFATHLPWHIIWRSFTGTLPRITELRLLLRGILTSISNPLCGLAEYGSETEHLEGEAIRDTATGTVRLRQVEGQTIARRGGSIFCPAHGEFLTESTTVTLLGTTTAITVTLI